MQISVITPVFNGERFIESCIRSVIDQNCPDVEHLIIDGCSTDRTLEIVKQYSETYPHIRWVSEKDKGQSDAMNKGIRMARGDLMGFLNADDFYEPSALTTALKIFQTLPEPSILIGNCNVIDEHGKLLWLNRPDTMYYQLLQVWRFKMPNNPSAYFYHRSLHEKIGEFEVEEHYAMDYDFLLRAFRAARVVYVDETFGNFRYYQGTKTSHNVDQGEIWNDARRIARKYAARAGPLYRLHLSLGLMVLHDGLNSLQPPSFSHRVKRRLLRYVQTLFDGVMQAAERVTE
jgi:glycosyltransferase involved in cell wall biosynthesis